MKLKGPVLESRDTEGDGPKDARLQVVIRVSLSTERSRRPPPPKRLVAPPYMPFVPLSHTSSPRKLPEPNLISPIAAIPSMKHYWSPVWHGSMENCRSEEDQERGVEPEARPSFAPPSEEQRRKVMSPALRALWREPGPNQCSPPHLTPG